MKTMLLGLVLAVLAPLSGDDHARGLQLLKEGKFAAAAAAFRAAAESDPTDPRVHYNLALALWRAGDAAEAELAAEKAATLSDGRLVPLRDGIFGNLRMSEAQGKLAGEQPDLQAALGAAQKARDHFLHGAAEPAAPAELTRNLERALQLITEIEKKIEEQKKEEKKDDQNKDGEQKPDDKDQEKQEKKDDGKQDESKDGKDPKSDEQKQDEQKKDDEKKDGKDQPKSDEQKEQDQKQQGKPEDKPPEPKPDQPKPDEKSEKGAPEAKPGEDKEQKPEPKVGADEQQQPPGEGKEAEAAPPPQMRELSPEETKRLLDVLEQLHAQQAELEKARAAARPKVKKDW